jgi:hypothetical protein
MRCQLPISELYTSESSHGSAGIFRATKQVEKRWKDGILVVSEASFSSSPYHRELPEEDCSMPGQQK